MPLVTGTPIGTLTTQEDLFLEGAPTIYFQRYEASELNNPDASLMYWGLSGSAIYPVYEIGCPADVTFGDNMTMNDVLCDNLGVKDTI